MTLLTNSFEGGTSGTTISTGNSGGGADTAFDVVNIPATATAAFDNAHAAHGTLAGKLATGATAGNVYVAWTTTMGTQATVWFRVYLYFTANPSATQRVAGFLAGASVSASFAVNSTGKVLALNAAGSTVTTSTTSIPLNQWFRLEGFATGSATVGQTEVKIFLTADSSTPDETDTSAANLNTTGSHTVYRFGHAVGSAIANLGPWWIDDLGLSSTGYIGPAVTASYLPGAARRIPYRTPALPPVRRYRAPVVPPQLDMPFPVTESRQWRQPRGVQPRRPHQFTVVPPQLNPPYPFAETVQRRETWARGLPRRGRQANVVPPQLNPPYPFSELRQWRQPRGFWPRRGHGFTPVPAQQSATPNPAWVPGPLRHARVMLPVRRRLPVIVPAAQDMPLRGTGPLRPRSLQPRRGHVTWPPQQQAAAVAPAWVQGHRAPPRAIALLIRRGRTAQPPVAVAPPPPWVQSHRSPPRAIVLIRRRFRQLLPWPQAVAPPFSVGTLTATGAPSGTLTASGTGAALTAVTAPQSALTAADKKAGGPS